MATEELKVRFKVDTSEVKSGADEAKNKVKSATSSMASDTKQASASMSSSMKDVQRATEGIGEATKTATTAVKQMEGQVSSSASQMKKNLGDVAAQVKSISTMQAISLTGRGLGALGGVMRGAANMMPEDWETGKTAMNVGAAAASGAERGLALGTTVGTAVAPFLGPETIAIGAALGAAAGALAGAASELFESAKKQEEAAEELRKNAEKSLAEHGRDLERRERFAGYDRENQVLLNGLGKTWWRSKDGTRSISGEERVFKVQEERQKTLDKATKERDEFVRAHKYDTGDAAKEAAQKLYYLDEAVNKAAQHLAALQPVVDAARRSQAEQAKAAEEAAKQAEKEAREREANIEAARKQSIRDQENGLKDDLKEGQRTLAGYQSQLQGVISKPAQSPTDALTRIGGGRGYTAYNNSTANIQKSIESNLRQLIKNQENQNQQIIDRLEALNQNPTQATWAS